MADIRITPANSIMSFTSSLNYIEKLTQEASGSLNLYGSGSTGRTEILSIDGNNGRLFTVSDDLSDSLFSVNTIAGLPVIEAFADNKVVLGQYGQNDLVITSDNKVCIGAATETDYKLNVVNSLGIGTSTTQYNGIFLVGNGTNNVSFFFEDTQYGEMKFGEEGNEIVAYQAALNISTGANQNINLLPGGTGNVGIGTSSPGSKLTVSGVGVSGTSVVKILGSDSGTFNWGSSTIFSNLTSGENVIHLFGLAESSNNSAYVGYKHSSNGSSSNMLTLGLYAADNLVNILANGNVGIGTQSPAAGHKLEVAGRIAAVNSFGDFTALQSSGGTGFRWALSNNSTFSLQKTTNGFSSVSATPIYIDSSNNVGISTTAPVRALQVGAFSGNPEICIGSGTTGFGSLVFGDSASGNNPWRGFVQYNHATDAMIIGTANASWLTLTSGGALGLNVNPTNTAGRFEASNDIVAYSSSDRRWKTNIKNIDSPLEKISQINGVEFDWIEDEPVHGNKGHDIGVIAQEIEQILPDAVQTRESGMKAVKYEKIIPLLIEVVKEQQKQIEELKQIVNGITR